MTPKAALHFTIPSLHDFLPLQCRIYLPSPSRQSSLTIPVRSHTSTPPASQSADTSPLASAASSTHVQDRPSGLGRKVAILAHPYAPLGGSQDDHVIVHLAGVLAREGWVVGTFNFRGAPGSKGRSSWTSKPEIADYESVVGLMVTYASSLAGLHHEGSNSHDHEVMDGMHAQTKDNTKIELLLAGYSYGSVVLSMMPPVANILRRFEKVEEGSATKDILAKAQELVQETLRLQSDLLIRARRREGDSVTLGSANESYHRHHHRISLDAARKSFEHVRHSVHRSPSKKTGHDELSPVSPPGVDTQPDTVASGRDSSPIDVRYLLISPLPGPLTALMTMSPSLLVPDGVRKLLKRPGNAGRQPGVSPGTLFSHHPTFAILGSKDQFTSAGRLSTWEKSIVRPTACNSTVTETSEATRVGCQTVIVEAADHFWHEEGLLEVMIKHIRDWLEA